ncbi:hypothetical protein [Vibrio salinus]|uniref:hypothetical protein n=1 Tax=Vibrio salinus TaxID=2899784 RepID=UPI001E5DAE23|nr:hypothetical protein [Vibrio salinus]MCE0495495.1 hypothetical protein [Vibrio salinus]
MGQESLSDCLDRIIRDILDNKPSRPKLMRVILTGNDTRSLVSTLNCLEALYHAGYGLAVTFSYTASHSVTKAVCLRWKEAKQIGVSFDTVSPDDDNSEYYGVFFPALSTNSMAKMALCLSDNLACEWLFHALHRNRSVVATLNADCNQLSASACSMALRKQLNQYIQTLEHYGVVFSGMHESNLNTASRVISVKDVRLHPKDEPFLIDRDVLITPAAKDELYYRNIAVRKIN